MSELILIEIVYDLEEQRIDFNIKTKHDDVMMRNKAELLDMLKVLTHRLEVCEYPFLSITNAVYVKGYGLCQLANFEKMPKGYTYHGYRKGYHIFSMNTEFYAVEVQ